MRYGRAIKTEGKGARTVAHLNLTAPISLDEPKGKVRPVRILPPRIVEKIVHVPMPAPSATELFRLREKVAIQAEEILQLRQFIGSAEEDKFRAACRSTFGLTKWQARLFSVLLEGRVRSADRLLYAYSDGAYSSLQCLKTQISRIRTRIGPHGFKIKNDWGTGYYIEPEERSAIKAMLETAAQ